MLTLAVPKGRLLTEILPLLSAIGCSPTVHPNESRTLILPTENPQVRLIIVRSQDAPTYVACKAADGGFAGGDVIAENPSDNIYQPITLAAGACRLVVAATKADTAITAGQRITVATKYVNLAREYFGLQGAHANIIKLYGSLELAPLVGLADVIVDLADTGNTMRANGLHEIAVIRHFSTMFIANRVSTRRNPLLLDIQQRIQEALPHD